MQAPAGEAQLYFSGDKATSHATVSGCRRAELSVCALAVPGLGSAHDSGGAPVLPPAWHHTASLLHLTRNVGFLLKAVSIKIGGFCNIVTPADLFGNNLLTGKYRFLTQKGAKEGTENCLCAGLNIYISGFAK